MFIGHEQQRIFFENILIKGTPAHAYLFYGPAYTGKRTFAKILASCLQGKPVPKLAQYFLAQTLNEGPTPDIFEINGTISVKELREVRRTLQHSSFSSPYKVLIIDEADKLSLESANTLLKILEEPYGKTIFFLIAPSFFSVIATIRSRCVALAFGYVDNALIETHLNTEPIKDLKAYWSGRPAAAIQLLQDKTELQKLRGINKYFTDFSSLSLAERFSGADQHAENSGPLFLHQWIHWAYSQKDHQFLKRLLASHKLLRTTNANMKYILHNLIINTYTR